MTRLGFVGVGRHAQKMATAFRECGAEVVAFARRRGFAYSFADNMHLQHPEGFGSHMPWPDMIASPEIDALIICAPPEVTTEVALACAKAGKRCVATKPLMLTEPPVWRGFPAPFELSDANLYVDLWRLYSPAWQALKAELRGKRIARIDVHFYGQGPDRAFSAALDWGPHALAFALDLAGPLGEQAFEPEHHGAGLNGLWTIWGGKELARQFIFGNRGAPVRRVTIMVEGEAATYVWEEIGEEQAARKATPSGIEVMATNARSLALRAFCRASLSGEPSDTLRISCEAMKVLMQLSSLAPELPAQLA